MKTMCPVCEGDKRLRYNVNHLYSLKEVETDCWACRGTGEVDYKVGVDFSTDVLKSLTATINVGE